MIPKLDIQTSQDVLDYIEAYTNHEAFVSNLAYTLSKRLGMDEDFCHDMAIAGMVHDIGKIKIRSYLKDRFHDILFVDEARYIRVHPTTGYAILKEQGFSDRILTAVLNHHENIDGSGYPNNLKGDDIPMEGRILHVCDTFAGVVQALGYFKTKALDRDRAMRMMIREVKNFDLKVFLEFQSFVYSDEFDKFLNDLEIDLR